MQDKGRGYAQHAANSMHAEFVKHESWKEESREQESLEEYDRVRWTKESREDREVREVRVFHSSKEIFLENACPFYVD